MQCCHIDSHPVPPVAIVPTTSTGRSPGRGLGQPGGLIFHHITRDCIACDACRPECPTGAISAGTTSPHYIIDKGQCLDCGACVPSCPVEAIVTKASPKEIAHDWSLRAEPPSGAN